MDFANLYNIDYERVILGMLLLDNSLINLVQGRLTVDCFYDAKTKFIYKKICELWKNDKHVDIVSLSDSLTKIDKMYIAQLTEVTCTTSNWEFYVNKIKEFYLARSFRTQLSESLSKLDPTKINDNISNLMSKLSSFMQENETGTEIKNLCVEIPEEIEKAHKEQRKYLGYETGYEDFDEILDGFQNGQMYVIGARPSIGKTAFALSLIRRLCAKGVGCSIFSLEMSCKQVFYRLLASVSKIPLWQLRKGTCLEYKQGVTRLLNACRALFEYDMNILDSGINSDEELYQRIRYEATVKERKVFVVDHLGLVQIASPSSNHYLDVGRITSTLHKLAKELNVCIILLCQMNREAEGKKPNLSLIRESGNIEQDADVIMFLHRERNLEEDCVPTQIIVEKNRDGKTGTANFIFNKQIQDFVVDKGLNNNDEIGKAPKIEVVAQSEHKIEEPTDVPFF